MKISFLNRQDAAKKLVEKLRRYQDANDALVVGLARGGVEVAFFVSQELRLPLDLICPKKITHPFDPEYAVGAVTEYGDLALDEEAAQQMGLSGSQIRDLEERKLEESKAKLRGFQNFRPGIDWNRKIIILVDDGLATGLTFLASVKSVKRFDPIRIVAAVPVCSNSASLKVIPLVDEFISLEIDPFLSSVGSYYKDFQEVTDQKVVEFFKKSQS